MKRKVFMNIFIIVVCIALISAATMAWFTDADAAGEAVFTAGTVSIEAGRKISLNDGDVVMGDFYPARVTGSEQGPAGYLKNQIVKKVRSNPKAVLSLETGKNEANFFSLGFGGWIIVEFDHPVYAPELVLVVEDTWGGNYPLEKADVYVSTTGEDGSWVHVGTADNHNLRRNQTYSECTLNIESVPYVRFVRVVDITDANDFTNYPNDNTVDGFDLNAIMIPGITSEEDNWNPGDCNESLYTIINTGSKRINLRGEVTGSWYEYDEESNDWISWTPDPDDNVVTISPADSSSGWVQQGGYFYYEPSIPGTYDGTPVEERTVGLKLKVCLAGEETDNQYQGKRYILRATFEAIQASNGAAASEGWYIND